MALSLPHNKNLLCNFRTYTNIFIRNRRKGEVLIRWPQVFKKWPDNVKYPGFLYYPRYPDQTDPPVKPSKLFMVQRVKNYWGIPRWEKKMLTDLRLDDKTTDIAIVLNTAHVCAKLWKIKHLVKITPITFPDGLPEDGNLTGTYLNRFGELEVNKNLRIDPIRMEITEKSLTGRKVLDEETVRKHSRLRWLNPFL